MNTKMLRIAKTLGYVGVFMLCLTALNVFGQQTDYGLSSTGRGITVSATDLVSNVKNIINFVLGVLGLIAVVVIIFAGIKLTSSAGNEDTMGEAKKTITYAVIGLLIVAFSWVIVEFVTRALIGAETGQIAT